MNHVPEARGRLSTRWTALVAAVLFAFVGCRGGELSDDEQRLVRDIAMSGLEHPSDPFVRAETLRAVELTEDPDVAGRAEDLLDDPNPMVRVIALRTVLRFGELDAPYRAARQVYNRAETADERRELLAVTLQHGDERARDMLLGRAMRDDSRELRLRALEGGLLHQIEQAREDGDEQTVRRELIPELREFVDDDPEIAAAALRELLRADQTEDARDLVETYSDESESIEERLRAGRALILARAEVAEDAFREVLDGAGDYDSDVIGFPDDTVDQGLLRVAVLGMTALGHSDYVRASQDYLGDVDTDTALYVLEALGTNPDEDAAITLRTHIRDARPRIRQRAIELYGSREDARPDAIFAALQQDDFETRELGIDTLIETFDDAWIERVDRRLNDPYAPTVEEMLGLLQKHLREDDEITALSSVQPRLEELATAESLPFESPNTDDEDELAEFERRMNRIQSRAAYLLFRLSGDYGTERYGELVGDDPAPDTLSAYLEYLATHDPQEHAAVLRDHLYDDFYVHRLYAAMGLWRAFSDSASWPGTPDGGDSE